MLFRSRIHTAAVTDRADRADRSAGEACHMLSPSMRSAAVPAESAELSAVKSSVALKTSVLQGHNGCAALAARHCC